MSKHTPGPWTASKPTRDNGRAEVYAGCMLTAQAFNWMLYAEGNEQCWADARLIAAAPELLEALKLARSIIGHPDDAHTQMIDAAIAKATGEHA